MRARRDSALSFRPVLRERAFFFGPYCIALGYLNVRSTFVPRPLGLVVAVAGVGWIAFASHLGGNQLATSIEVVGVLAEGSLMLWLLAIGVNVPRLDALMRRKRARL